MTEEKTMALRKTEPVYAQLLGEFQKERGSKTTPEVQLRRLRKRTQGADTSLGELAHSHRVAALAAGSLEPLPFPAGSIDHTRKERDPVSAPLDVVSVEDIKITWAELTGS